MSELFEKNIEPYKPIFLRDTKIDIIERDKINRLMGLVYKINTSQIPQYEKLPELKDEPIIEPSYDNKTFNTQIYKGPVTSLSTKRKARIKPTTIQTKTDEFNIDEYRRMLLTKQQPKILKASEYILDNREIFPRFIEQLFKPYTLDDKTQKSSDDEYTLLPHQRIIRDYLSIETPYRGLLLYHGLGSGKTCASIGVAEALKSYKEIVVMTPAFLRNNFIKELKQCGDFLFRLNQHWVYYQFDKKNPVINKLIRIFPLTEDYLKSQGGIWLAKYHKSPNYNLLTDEEKKSLNQQIDEMIRAKYQFINYNGITEDNYNMLTDNRTINPFDNKVIIIDEVHNFIVTIINSINSGKDNVATSMYSFLKSAENCKIVFLSGTPIVNYPNELGILFNMLRGNIKMFSFYLNSEDNIKQEQVESILEPILDIDYLEYNPSTKILNIIRNPYGFYKVYDYGDKTQKKYKTLKKGILKKKQSTTRRKKNVTFKGGRRKTKGVRRKDHYKNDISFERLIKNILKENGMNVEKVTKEYFDALPDDLDTFTNMFIKNTKKGEIMNENSLKRRILGLTSYFHGSNEDLLPTKHEEQIIEIPFGEYQYNEYIKIRNEEIRKQKRADKKKKIGLFSSAQGSYRTFSRLCCNFVFPETISRPKRSKDVDQKEYDTLIKNAIDDIKNHEDDYLSEENIEKYSPKMYEILNHMKTHQNNGCQLLYSQFRSVEGIEIMKHVLIKNGYEEFKISKDESGDWVLNMNNYDKPTFVLHTGKEPGEIKEIYRNIFNSDWDKVPESLINGLKTLMNVDMTRKNIYGDIIQTIIISESGSEGIDLKNVQYVHIMEPYWNYVRIKQVIGRAVRLKSHLDLPEDKREVHIYIYLMKFSDEQIEILPKEIKIYDSSRENKNKYLTTDQSLWEISLIKDKINTELIRCVKEASMDCLLYPEQSSKEGLKCFVFDTNDPDKRAYRASYEQEQTDQIEELNYNVVERRLKATKDGKYLIDLDTKQVFNNETYKQTSQLIQIGTYNPKTRSVRPI